MESNNNNGVAWAGLVIAVLALIVAWSAFNRAGQDLVPTVVDESEEAAEFIAETSDRAEDELDEEFVDENEPGDEVETDASIEVTN